MSRIHCHQGQYMIYSFESTENKFRHHYSILLNNVVNIFLLEEVHLHDTPCKILLKYTVCIVLDNLGTLFCRKLSKIQRSIGSSNSQDTQGILYHIASTVQDLHIGSNCQLGSHSTALSQYPRKDQPGKPNKN
jgi:hypothetical protein